MADSGNLTAAAPGQVDFSMRAASTAHPRNSDSWINPAQAESDSHESVIRQLQAQAAKHGELLDGLLPPMRIFESLLRIQQPREEQVSGLFNEEIDLFAEVRDTLHSPESQETGYQAHKMWINHMRQWCRDENNARRLRPRSPYVKAGCRHSLTTSYRLEMPQRLQRIMQRENVCAAQLHADIGDFITWLGFADVAEEQRPASRIQKGSAIFSAPKQSPMLRLTKLDEQPCMVQAVTFTTGWLPCTPARMRMWISASTGCH